MIFSLPDPCSFWHEIPAANGVFLTLQKSGPDAPEMLTAAYSVSQISVAMRPVTPSRR